MISLRMTAMIAVALSCATGQGAADIPAHLRLGAAEIVEAAAPASDIVFRMETDSPPTCGVSYAFLIDADKSLKTGTVTRAIPELGVDLQVEMRCDAARRTFVSDAGDVTMRPATNIGDPHVVEVTVHRETLSSLDFYWIAIAREGNHVTRLPEPGRFEAWRPLERWLH